MGLFSNDGEPVRQKTAQTLNTELGKSLPMRILLAEDNVVNQRVAVRLLEKMGYRPDIAGNDWRSSSLETPALRPGVNGYPCPKWTASRRLV
jgi:hypothetical protein